ncbi:MAG: hypothetical protein ABI587_10540 [Gemmatimonadales bacterium]
MRGSTAVGLFLVLGGLMVLVLQPTYRVPVESNIRNLEATAPPEEYRPIPAWVGLLAIGAGAGALVLGARQPRGRRS